MNNSLRVKKCCYIIFLILIFFIYIGVTNTKADEIINDDWVYSLQDDYICIDEYIGDGKNVMVPEQIDDYMVQKIGYNAFGGCDEIESVIIPEGVKIIDDEAFLHCVNLKSVELPKSLEYIGDYSFCECENLKSVVLYEGVKSIGNYSFSECKKLSTVQLSNGLESIGEYAFNECQNLINIDIPKSVINIGEFAFYEGIQVKCHSSYVWKYMKDYDTDSIYHSFMVSNIIKAKPNKDGTITKVCTECGEKNVTQIYAPKSITLDKTSYIYDGNTHKPNVIVKDSKGKVITASNYNVTYENNINVGSKKIKPTVKVIFKGELYTGQLVKDFTINKASNKFTGSFVYNKLSSTKQQNFKINIKAIGEKLKFKSNDKNIKIDGNGKVTIAKNYVGCGTITVTSENSNYKVIKKDIKIVVKPNKNSIYSLKNNGLNKIAVRWRNSPGVEGYQVQYSAQKNFSMSITKNVKGGKTNYIVLDKLTKGTRYYVRVRGYKTYAGIKYYATWSGVKSINISNGKDEKIKGVPNIISQKQVNKEFKNLVTWTSVSGATGYQVCYKKGENGKWVSIGNTTSRSYQMNVVHGVTYYFCVRAYKQKKDGSKIYSSYSSSSKGLMVSYMPNYNLEMPWGYGSFYYIIGQVQNNGKLSIRIYSEGASLKDNEYDYYNRKVELLDEDAYYRGKIRSVSYVDILPGDTKDIVFCVIGDETWYDSKTTISYNLFYDNKYYVGKTSASGGTVVNSK